MKRTMKKLAALIMALAMVMSLVVTASAAAGEPTLVVTKGEGIAADFVSGNVRFDWTATDDEVKSGFLTDLTAAGKDVTITVAGDFTTSSTAAFALDGYSVANPTTVSGKWEVAITKTEGSVAIGKLVITLPEGETTGGTITVKLKGTGGAGDDALTEADADNSKDAITGAGTYEGYVDQEVFRVTLPTVTADDIAFTIDPQGLIAATAAGAHTGKKFTEAGSMFFLNTNNKVKVKEGSDDDADYSPNSDKFTVINKGASDVDVELTLTASGTALGENPTISFVEAVADFADSEDTSLYIALNAKGTGDEKTTVEPIAKDGTAYKATATASIAKTDGVYEYKYDETDGYTYGLKDDADGFKELEFWLSGAANTNATGDWGLTAGSLALALTWKVTKAESGGSGPRVTAEAVEGLSRNMEITLNVANATGYTLKSVTYGEESPTDVGATMTEVAADGTATITFTVDRTMVSAAPTAVNVIFTNTETEADTPAKSVTIVAAA